jgi:hypothetical protein
LPIATDKETTSGKQNYLLKFHPKVFSRSTDKDQDDGLQASLEIKGEPTLMSPMTSLS